LRTANDLTCNTWKGAHVSLPDIDNVTDVGIKTGTEVRRKGETALDDMGLAACQVAITWERALAAAAAAAATTASVSGT
jgi:hypothetical protein